MMTPTFHPRRRGVTFSDLATRWAIGIVMCLIASIPFLSALGADWPSFRHDVTRSGVTSEQLRVPLTECWAFHALHAPRPAWGDPKPVPLENILELRRVHFDDVFQPVAGSGRMFFGSSADHKVYCLDMGTGKIRWTFITGGPIRLAPTLANNKIYVGSDDGWIYCLSADDGSVVWKLRAAPEDRRVLGQGKMISLWPSRTGVLVDGGVAYFAAGFFPTEGVFFYAVDAETGKVLWKNDTTGERPQGRVAPQGYLLASGARLYAPMGRVSPAAFDRLSGRLLYETSFGKQVGGSYALIAGDAVYTGTEGIVAFHQATRDKFAAFPGRRMVVTDKTYYVATNTELLAMDRQAKSTRWRVRCDAADELILAGSTLFAGGADHVVAVDARTGKTQWRAPVEGAAKGLAVSDGRLLVSTDKGWIYCFGPDGTPRAGLVRPPVIDNPFGPAAASSAFGEAAQTILEQTGVERGYCLVLGCETGQLAVQLARRSELMILAVTSDPKKAAKARATIDSTGLLGARISVDCWPLDELPYADWFANLVVSETAMVHGRWPVAPKKILRLIKPLGGTLMIGTSSAKLDGSKTFDKLAADKLLTLAEFAGAQWLERDGKWVKFVRGRLPGSGNWTQQYGNLGNTACGDDTRVKAPLDVLWFGRPGPGKMVNRHRRSASPVAYEGRMFVEGENVLMAYDAYNGVKLWERAIPGAVRVNASHDGGNLAVSNKGLFVAINENCLRLDLDTGQTLSTYKVSVAGGFKRWGYIALDGSLLYGSRAAGVGSSNEIFCIDVETGKQLWMYQGKRILHNGIAIGDGQLMLVRYDVTPAQREAALRQSGVDPASPSAAKRLVRLVVALDAKTGKVRWQNPLDLTHCGDLIAAIYNDGVLVLFGVYLDGHYWKQFFAGEFKSRAVTAVNAKTGKVLWSKAVGYRVRPLVIDDTLHAEPWAFDLKTGKQKTRINPITGIEEPWQFARPGHHCGCPAAARNFLLFRSWNLGFYDLIGDYGTTHFAGQRPGCWISFIPAAGLVLMPESSTGCMCDFPNQGTVVFQPTSRHRAWAWYSTFGPVQPVKRLGMNLGAPGDRPDPEGALWLGYPRPRGSLVLQHQLNASFYPGGRFRQRNSTYVDVAETDKPWLFASEANGLRKLEIPILNTGDGKALYQVRLLFADPDDTKAGQRVFDIKLQGKTVAEGFDIVDRAGGSRRAVSAVFKDIEVDGTLTVELVAGTGRPKPNALPLINGIEIARQRFTVPGCIVPSLLLNDKRPEKRETIALANLCDAPFDGSIRFTPPSEITVTPAKQAIHLPTGTRKDIPLTVHVAKGTPAGKYSVRVDLVRADGTVQLQRTMPIEHLGPRSRVIIKATEDAHVSKRYVDRNQGTAGVLLVDGGKQRVGDQDHAVALIKFPLKIPGKVVVARLRIVDAGNPTGNAGDVRLVEGSWTEAKVTYATRPKLGAVLAKLGPVQPHEVIDRKLDVDLTGKTELSIAIDPTGADGVDFLSREGGRPPELIIDYEETVK